MTAFATAQDLATFLEQDVDTARAELVISLAQGQVESYIAVPDPVPAAVQGVVLAAAARMFVNPTSVMSETVGPYTAQRAGGLYLSRAERATLRRVSGSSGAFSIDPTPIDAAPPYGGLLYPEGPLLVPGTGEDYRP